MIAEEQVREHLNKVLVPEVKRSLMELNLVRQVAVADDKVNISLASTALNPDIQNNSYIRRNSSKY